MKKALFVYLFFISGIISAQVKLSKGEMQEPVDKELPKYRLTTENVQSCKCGHLYSIAEKDNYVYLVSYNENDLKLETYKELVFGKKTNEVPKTFSYEEIDKRDKVKSKLIEFGYRQSFIIKDKVYLIYRNKDEEEKRRLFVQTYDLNGVPINTSIEILGPGGTEYNGDNIFQISQDSSMIFSYRSNVKKGEKDRMNVSVWNLDFELLHTADIELETERNQSKFYDCYLTKDFKMVGLYNTEIPEEIREKNGPDEEIKAILFDIPHASKEDLDFNLKDFLIRDLYFQFDDNQNPYCAGTFSKNKNRLSIDGTFYFKLDTNTGDITAVHTQEFSTDIIQKMNSKESNRRRWYRDSAFNIELKNVFAKSDGGCYLLFEEAYYQYVSINGPSGNTSYQYYINNDILIMSISPSGDVVWQNVIPKQQESELRGFFNSFYATYYNDKLYIFYNEDIDNISNENHERLVTPDASNFVIPVVYTIEEDGSMESKGLVPIDKKQEFSIAFNYTKRLEQDKAIFFEMDMSKFGSFKRFRIDCMIIE